MPNEPTVVRKSLFTFLFRDDTSEMGVAEPMPHDIEKYVAGLPAPDRAALFEALGVVAKPWQMCRAVCDGGRICALDAGHPQPHGEHYRRGFEDGARAQADQDVVRLRDNGHSTAARWLATIAPVEPPPDEEVADLLSIWPEPSREDDGKGAHRCTKMVADMTRGVGVCPECGKENPGEQTIEDAFRRAAEEIGLTKRPPREDDGKEGETIDAQHIRDVLTTGAALAKWCPTCHNTREVGTGQMVGGLRKLGELGGGVRELKKPCPTCLPVSAKIAAAQPPKQAERTYAIGDVLESIDTQSRTPTGNMFRIVGEPHLDEGTLRARIESVNEDVSCAPFADLPGNWIHHPKQAERGGEDAKAAWRKLVGERDDVGDRLQTLVDETFGYQPTMTTEALVNFLERELPKRSGEHKKHRNENDALRAKVARQRKELRRLNVAIAKHTAAAKAAESRSAADSTRRHEMFRSLRLVAKALGVHAPPFEEEIVAALVEFAENRANAVPPVFAERIEAADLSARDAIAAKEAAERERDRLQQSRDEIIASFVTEGDLTEPDVVRAIVDRLSRAADMWSIRVAELTADAREHGVRVADLVATAVENATADRDALAAKVAEIETLWSRACATVQTHVQTHRLGSGGENIFELTVREHEKALAKLAAIESREGPAEAWRTGEPPEPGRYSVTVDAEYDQVRTSWWLNGEWQQDHVIAWRPLPPPYRPDESSTKPAGS